MMQPEHKPDDCWYKDVCLDNNAAAPYCNRCTTEQPAPLPNKREPIMQLVMLDLQARYEKGLQTYGTPLQAFNGRDALWDAYEEALDLACYLRQAIEEHRAASTTQRQSAGLDEVKYGGHKVSDS